MSSGEGALTARSNGLAGSREGSKLTGKTGSPEAACRDPSCIRRHGCVPFYAFKNLFGPAKPYNEDSLAVVVVTVLRCPVYIALS
jgi:hypothetical protein